MQNFKNPKLNDAGGDLAGRWFVYYSYRNPDSGKFERFRVFISQQIITKSGRRDEAHRIMAELAAKLNEGWNPYQYREKKYEPLVESLNKVLQLKLVSTRRRTSLSYSYILRQFLQWITLRHYQHMKVSEFSKFNAQQYLDYLKTNRLYANRTFNNHLLSLRTLFADLLKREYVLSNPFAGFDYLPVEEAQIIAYTQQELELISRTLPDYNPRLWLVAQLVYYCFIRPQEIVRMRFADIDMHRRQISLAGRQTKNKRTQMVDIPDAFYEELKGMKWEDPRWYIFSTSLQPGARQIFQTGIDRVWAVYRQAVGLPPEKGLYAMKHTGAGRLADAGVDLRSIQLQMRHHSLDETQKYFDRFRRTPNTTLRKLTPKI